MHMCVYKAYLRITVYKEKRFICFEHIIEKYYALNVFKIPE